MTKTIVDCVDIMRLAISRRNQNDPDSTFDTLAGYCDDFSTLFMPNEVHLFENCGTLEFFIQEGVDTYTWDEIGFTAGFVNMSMSAFITNMDNTLNTNELAIYFDPFEFYSYWYIFDVTKLIPGMPSDMLFYGENEANPSDPDLIPDPTRPNTVVFRTVPDREYKVRIYSYKTNTSLLPYQDEDDVTVNPPLAFDYWYRFIAYGAALNYASDYNYSQEALASIQRSFNKEKKLLLTRTHNQRKFGRAFPRI